MRALEAQRQVKDTELREQCKARDAQFWQRIEAVIKVEEAEVAALVAEEKRKAEEAERQKREETERRLAEERKRVGWRNRRT